MLEPYRIFDQVELGSGLFYAIRFLPAVAEVKMSDSLGKALGGNACGAERGIGRENIVDAVGSPNPGVYGGVPFREKLTPSVWKKISLAV